MSDPRKKLEQCLKALANCKRLAILLYLKQKQRDTAPMIARAIGLSVQPTSVHLRILHDAGIVKVQTHEDSVLYSLATHQEEPVTFLLQSPRINSRNVECLLKALANHKRLQILSFLKKEECMSVLKLARTIHLAFRSTSKHLHRITTVDILETRKESLYVFYRIAKKQAPLVRTVLKML